MTQARDLADGKFDTSTLVVDAANDRVGISNGSPGYKLDVDVTGSAVRLNSATSQALLVLSSDDAANAKIEFGDESDNDRGAITYDNPNNAMIFQTNTSEKMRILSGGGLTFNGDTAAANALDDYEEGTWTAQMLGTATNPTNTVNAASAQYIKIGRLVWAGAQFVNVNTTGASGGVVVSGMPYNSDFTIPMGNVMSQNTFNVGSTVANITPY